MLVQEKRRAGIANRINKLCPDHFIWINSQIKANKYLATRGREVFVKKAGTSSVNIVNIPPKGASNYFDAWIKVYNYALDYLESTINYACRENKFIKNYNNNWLLNGKVIIWPRFNPETAEYAIKLDKIFDEYVNVKLNYINSSRKSNDEIRVKKRSTYLKKASEIDEKNIQSTNYAAPVNQRSVVKNDLKNSKLVFEKGKPVLVEDKKNIQKISDGDVLDTRDLSKLQSSKTDIVVITCQDVLVPKEEDIFMDNFEKCQNEGFKTGAFFYGKATDDHAAAIELKRMLKLLAKCGSDFSGLVIYSINNDFIIKNKESDINLLNFINMYNSIGNTLKQYGYSVMISMNLESAKIIEDINTRYNMQDEHDTIYMAFVRDEPDIGPNTSSIIVDPGNDYDIVNIKNKEILAKISIKDLNRRI